MGVGEDVGPAGSHGNLDTFYGLADQVAQGAVEVVEIPKVVKSRARKELVGVALGGDWVAIGGEAIIIVML